MARPLAFDIETVGRASCADLVKPARNLKDPAKIAADLEERRAKMALRPDFADIVLLGWQRQGEAPVLWLARSDDDRREGLELFWQAWMAHQTRLCFNGLRYDLPVLVRQSQLLSVDYPRGIDLSRYHPDAIDLMSELTFRGEIDPLGLVAYCRLFGREATAEDGDGGQVAAWYAAQDWTAIKTHCAEDLARTLWLAERIGTIRPVGCEVTK